MRFTVTSDRGDPVELECLDTVTSRWVCGEILKGRTYPHLACARDVRVVVDVGAYCGAASVYFARRHPHATVHAVEPATRVREILVRNAAHYPNIRVHGLALGARDGTVPFFEVDDLGTVRRHTADDEVSELVQLRHAGRWAAETGIDRIDVLKVDVEGSEVDVLTSLAALLPTVQVLYVEYDSRDARREIDAALAPTHVLFRSFAFLDQGESIYVRNDVAHWSDPPQPRDPIRFPSLSFLEDDPVTVDLDALRELGAGTASLPALIVEHVGEEARREVDVRLAPTHHLYAGAQYLDGGTHLYLRSDVATSDEAARALAQLFAAPMDAATARGSDRQRPPTRGS